MSRAAPMTAAECLSEAKGAGGGFQAVINVFVDDFRRATAEQRDQMLAEPILQSGALEGLVAAVISALCREVSRESPEWGRRIHSPDPFFAFPAKSYALRVRLLFESPPAFRVRNVFVPENYLSRA